MELAVYAHPWDLRALETHGGLGRLRDLGFREVALATAYHAGRWLTPWSGEGMVRFLEDGTVHFRPRQAYGALQPVASSEVAAERPSPLEELCGQAPAAGLKVRAWTVFFHNTRLGELHPDSCMVNCFGDRYPYALCPARPEVQEYGVALLRDVCRHEGLGTIELEAFGWMGHRHNSHHDKSSFAPEPYVDVLLSLCFCEACRAGVARLPVEGGHRVDFDALREKVCHELRRRLTDGDAMVPERVAPGALVERLREDFGLDAMAMLGHRFISLMVAAMGAHPIGLEAGVAVALQAAWDPLRNGTSPPLVGPVTEMENVVTCYGDGPEGIGRALARVRELRAQGVGGQGALRLSIHPRAPQFTSDDDLARVRESCSQHGVASVAIYHLGLLPWRTIERVGKILGR